MFSQPRIGVAFLLAAKAFEPPPPPALLALRVRAVSSSGIPLQDFLWGEHPMVPVHGRDL